MESLTQRIWLLKDSLLGRLFCVIGGFLPKMIPKVKDLSGKTAIVSGSNSGVGYGFALQLAEMGATVYLACRNEQRAAQAQADMLATCPEARIRTLSLDTASFDSVRRFARDWNHGPIHVLAHNAGTTLLPKGKDFTDDGYEYQYQVNFLSSFLLTRLLEDQLATDARVILTSSIGSYFGSLSDDFAITKTQKTIEDGFHAAPRDHGNLARYARTKLMQAAFAKALQARYDAHDSQRLVYSFEPGLVQTNLLQDVAQAPFDPIIWMLEKIMPMCGLSVRQGSATGVHLATSDSPEVVQNKGRYFDRMWPRAHAVDTYSKEKLDRLWTRWTADCEM